MLIITVEREGRRWTRAELARQTAMSASTVGQIESGRLRPYDSQLHKIMVALEWTGPPDGLLQEVPDARD